MSTSKAKDRTRRPSQLPPTGSPTPPVPLEQPDASVEDSRAVRAREAAIDAALEMTFPASDPPSWTP